MELLPRVISVRLIRLALQVSELLPAVGANVNGQSESGTTVLMDAVWQGHHEVIDVRLGFM